MTLFDKTRVYLGGDPGSSGAIAVVTENGDYVKTYATHNDDHSKWRHLATSLTERYEFVGGYVERVYGVIATGKKERQSPSSLITQGIGIGQMQMFVGLLGLNPRIIIPQTWVSFYKLKRPRNIKTTEWKDILYRKAQTLFPFGFPKYAADAVLIANLCKHFRGADPRKSPPKPKTRKRVTVAKSTKPRPLVTDVKKPF